MDVRNVACTRAHEPVGRNVLERKVSELPEIFRVVFVIRSVEELSVEETAQCLDISEETVRSRHFRARSLVDAVEVPVVAAGGIADGRGIGAALMLGASAVQIGTGFLRCPSAALARPLPAGILYRQLWQEASTLLGIR